MTYLELEAKLRTLTPEQKAQKVAFSGFERRGGDIESLWIAEEDHINPTGEGDEPISVYADDPDFIASEERITVRKGEVLLLEEG